MEHHKAVVEGLAAYAHVAWSGWMKYLFMKGIDNADGSFTIDATQVARWKRQMNTAYADLPEVEKHSDRAEANTILTILAGFAMSLKQK